jgi:hypothetical protein
MSAVGNRKLIQQKFNSFTSVEHTSPQINMMNGVEVDSDDIPNGAGHTPRTPSLNGFSLTEYTANPTPPRSKSPQGSSVIPRDFRLPNGYPDVRYPF